MKIRMATLAAIAMIASACGSSRHNHGGSSPIVTPSPSPNPSPSPTPSPSPSPSPVVISPATGALPDGKVGLSYSEQLSATGDVPPYRWEVTTGSLPTGLTIAQSTGVISGTPTQAGSFSFAVEATGAAGGGGISTFTITIQ